MSFLDRLFGKSAKKVPVTTRGRTSSSPQGFGVVDLRSDEERKMAGRSQSEHQRIAQQHGVSILFNELVGLVKKDNSGFAEKTRIREIGEELNRRGGFKLMQEAYYHVRNTGTYFSQDIWHRIGEWEQ